MRICILSPAALASNPRVIKEASALAEAGYEVASINVRTLDSVDAGDETVLEKANWRAGRLDFRRRGLRWHTLRTSQIAIQRLFFATGIDRFADSAISPFTPALIHAAKRMPADLYIAHYPAALPAAAVAARANRAGYAYDAEDFHLGDWPDGAEHEMKRQLLRAVEGRHLAKCAYVTAASPGIADAYAAAYGISTPQVILNAFPRSDAPEPGSASRTAGPSVYWFSQTIGPDRGLEAAVEAIGYARTQPHLYLRGNPSEGFAELLRSIAVRVGVANRLHFLPLDVPSKMVSAASIYDVGLSSEPGHTPNNRLALGNKIFTYLLAGIPVLLSDVPSHRSFVRELGDAARLYTANGAKALAAAIDGLVGNAEALAGARIAASLLGRKRFNWDIEKSRLLDCVAAAVGASRQAQPLLPVVQNAR